MTNDNRPSNYVVFGLIFEDRQIFKETVKCILGDELNDGAYIVSEKENRMGGALYNKIRFDVYAESDKIYSLDMQNGYTSDMIRNRLVYYACRAVGSQEVKNSEYDKLKTCVVTFIFEKNSHNSKQFLTNYYMAADIDGKTIKYSDLLNVVELNLGYYTETDNTDLNILCEFLRIQDSKNLKKFYEKHTNSEFGRILYDKYMKVSLDKDRIERVKYMNLYQAKSQVKYLSENDVEFLWKQRGEEMATNMLKKNKYTIEEISESTEITIERVKELQDELTLN